MLRNTAEHRLNKDCRARSEQKTTSSEENSCVRAAGSLPVWQGQHWLSPSPGSWERLQEVQEPVLSLAAPIWKSHPNTNVGAILAFQASKLDLSLLWSASVYWSHSRTSLTAEYLAELNTRFEDGEIGRCGKKKGRLGWSLFPSHCEAESDPFPRHSGSSVSRVNEASFPPHLTN